jgi:aldehyde dehydrogenase family protein
MITRDKLYIGGTWVEPSNSDTLEIRSPHDQSVLGRVVQATNPGIDRAVAAAREAFDHGPWTHTNPRGTAGDHQALERPARGTGGTRSRRRSRRRTAQRCGLRNWDSRSSPDRSMPISRPRQNSRGKGSLSLRIPPWPSAPSCGASRSA